MMVWCTRARRGAVPAGSTPWRLLPLALLLLALGTGRAPAEDGAGLGWLEAPSASGDLDTLMAPPGRPLGGLNPERDPALSPNGRWLAYSALVDGNWDIWLRDLQAGPGELPRRLTSHVAADLRPRFAHDGSAVLFISQRDDAAGDIWELPLSRWTGRLRIGEPRLLLRRPGTQDHPVRAADGSLYWDEESSSGRRVMRWDGASPVRELARPAVLPRPGHGGLYLLSLADSTRITLEWLPDSLLATARPGTPRLRVWSPAEAILEYEAGPGDHLWAITLDKGQVRRPGEDLATPSQLWQVGRLLTKPPRPLLEQGRSPRQLALAGRRLVYTEDQRPSVLWLEDADGRFPMGRAERGREGAAPGASPATASAASWLELSRRYAGNELGLPLLQTIQATWPGSPAADEAALREMRQRMSEGGDPPALRARLDELRGWLHGPEAIARLEAMALEIGFRESRATDLSPLADLARRSRDDGLPGASAEASLARARLEMHAGRPERVLGALLDLEFLPDSLAEQADGLALKIHALEELGQADAARGALARLAGRHQDRPDLLANWLRRDLAGLTELPDSRARLRLRERLTVLGSIPALRMALIVELARREAAAGRDGRAVAGEDLRLALEESPARLGPFERRAWTQGQGLQAELRRQDGRLGDALDGLRSADEALSGAGEPALAAILRVKRIDWLLERAWTASEAQDWEAAAADTRLILQLDPAETRAWRLRIEAMARLERLDEEETDLRARREQAGRQAATLRGMALRRRAVETWALGLLLSWRAEDQPAWLPESDLLIEEALSLDDRLGPACLTLSWNLGREIQLASTRRGGVKGLLRELGRGREAVSRLRHRGIGRLKDPDEESMRDRAILLAERGLRWTDVGRDPDLAVALTTHLGNLHFLLGEFGAQQAQRAWERRLDISTHFRNPLEQLRFTSNLGTVRQWSGDLERAALDLDSAQVLAARLNLLPERRGLLARLSMLAGERGRPFEAQAWLRQALALEGDPGQRALLLRNLAMIQMELGDEEPGRRSLEQAAREAELGDWPMEPAQNWLRVQILGLSVPLWNFPGLYTGQGRLDWGPREEEGLRQALRDEMSGRQGALDQRMRGMHARRRLLRRQGDTDGMLRLDLGLARELASLGRWEEGVLRFMETARLAHEAVLTGLEARAVEGAMSSLLMGRRAASREDPAASLRLEALAPRVHDGLEGLLATGAVLLPPEQRLRLELLRVLDLDDRAIVADPVGALLLRCQALLLLEDLVNWRKSAELVWTPRQQLQLDLAWSRLLTMTGDASGGLARLSGWKLKELPPESALLVAWGRLQAERSLRRGEVVRDLEEDLRRLLLDLPADPDRLLAVRRAEPVLDGLDLLAEERGPQAAAAAADWRAWWEGRRLWEQADPPFPAESWKNAWGNQRADLSERARTQEAILGGAPTAALALADSALAGSRAGMRGDPRLSLWLEPTPDAAKAWPALRDEGMRWLGMSDSLGSWLLGSPSVHAACRANTVLSPDEATLIRVIQAGPALRTGLRQTPPAGLRDQAASGLDARLLCVDGILRLVPGAPHAAWLDIGGQRVPLRELMGLDLPGELLVFGEVDWQGQRPESWREGWLVLERLLAQSGLRRAMLPGPGLRLHGRQLEDLALAILADSLTTVPAGWWAVGAPLLSPELRREGQRRGMEELVQLGNEYRRLEEHDSAWRVYRRALRLAVQLGDDPSAGRLARLGAASALDGQRPGQALDVLLEELSRTDPASVEWDKIAGRLVQLADLAGREAQADSLWRRLVVEGRVLAPPERAPLPQSASVQELRAALENRLLSLERRGARERAAALARGANLMPIGEDPRRAIFLARLYLDTESARLAWECLQAAELRWERLDSLETLEVHELRSIIALRLGNLADSRFWMGRAVAQAAGMRLAGDRLALHLQRRADLAWSLGQYGDCAILLDEAEAALPAGDLRLSLLLANTRGLLATELEEDAEASARFSRAQELGMQLGDPLELSAVYNNMSRLAQRGGRWLEALEASQRAQEQDSLSGSPRRSLVTLRNRATAQRGLLAPELNLPEAWTSLPEGLLRQRHASSELTRLARELERGLALARELGEDREACRLELELAWLDLDLGRVDEALLAAQACAGRASRLLFQREALEARLVAGRALVRLKRPGPAEDLLLRALTEAEEETARLAPVRFDPGRGMLQRRITDELVSLYAADRPWDALAASERGRNLGLQEMTARRAGDDRMPAPRGRGELETLLRSSLEPGQQMLGWHMGHEQAWGFLWDGGRLSLWPLPASRDSVRLLTGLHRARILAFLSPEQTGQRLARWLLPAAWLEHPPARAWLLPQGELHELAFESLVLKDGAWLGSHTALCRSGSLAELGFSSRLPGGTGAGAIWSNPQVTGLATLEFTSLEAGELERLFPDSRLLEGRNATAAEVRDDGLARRFRHFACHARHDPRSPAESALLLSPGPADDGRLRAPEIAALGMPAGLTVLSACETGLGRGGEESSAGLPRAFMAAGSRGVLASLWKVDDLATAVLIKHLYRALADGVPADLALQRAQEAVRIWVHPHPAYWAAFALTGQPRPAAGPAPRR